MPAKTNTEYKEYLENLLASSEEDLVKNERLGKMNKKGKDKEDVSHP